MKKLTNEYRFDARLGWLPWLKAQLAVFASFTRLIDSSQSPDKGPGGKSTGASGNSTPGSASGRTVQQDTDLGG